MSKVDKHLDGATQERSSSGGEPPLMGASEVTTAAPQLVLDGVETWKMSPEFGQLRWADTWGRCATC